MSARDASVIHELIDRVPALRPVLEEHLDAYDTLLPHVLMGDITRWLIDRFRLDPHDQSMQDALEFLDRSFTTSRGADTELIAASFLENLPRAGEDGAGLRDRVGPALREHLERFG